MKKIQTEQQAGRRELLKMMALGSTAGFLGLTGITQVNAQDKQTPSYANGVGPVKIKSVKAIATARRNKPHCKSRTTEPGLYLDALRLLNGLRGCGHY
jgi:mannonate dehydratase